jgi:ABC-type sugar transport system permease subunit
LVAKRGKARGLALHDGVSCVMQASSLGRPSWPVRSTTQSALQDVDQTLYEAAGIDGANAIQQFFHVTVPMVRTVTSVVVTLNLINGLKIFDIIYVMTGGGPDHASESLSTYLYSLAFGGQVAGAIPAVG